MDIPADRQTLSSAREGNDVAPAPSGAALSRTASLHEIGVLDRAVRLRRLNVGKRERWASVLLGAGLLARAPRMQTGPAIATGVVGAYLLKRGLLGRCGIYGALGVATTRGRLEPGDGTAGPLQRALRRQSRVARAVTVAAPPERVRAALDDGQLVARALRVHAIDGEADGSWRVHGTGEEPAVWHVQRTVEPSADGPVRFAARAGDAEEVQGVLELVAAPGNRGTELRLVLETRGLRPVLRRPGRADRVAAEALHRLKQLLEAGVVVTAAGPSGRRR